ncbi:class IV adenylate cyclase [Clostridium perfringens]|uniref:class IV adenylate cyclase n=1 Tax=Clostridium perfringens TaxID=1502 RepID=UPI002A44F04D|nr:CYTH domain-containing protein [Clostridium perfringens]EJT6158582.1 CYTH domain-containing protein [Clostridium perfringens]WPQ44517.1 CYTH domain-containing protein [Clostridium perfringens]
MKELETRIIDIDVEKIRKTLNKLGAENVKRENQTNDIFDFPDRKLLDKKGYARIRTVEDLINNKTVYFMTTKKMLSQDKFKVMEENETIIEDGSMGKNIFKSLGLELFETIKKYRESYKYKDSLIEIDINDPSFCPFPYIEIETSSEEKLSEILIDLGYSMEDTTSKTIYEILKDKGISPDSNKKGL